MAYSAGSGGPPPAGITGQNNNQTNTTQYQNDNVEETTNVQNANSDLQMLFDARKNKLPLTNPVVNAIHKSTERAVKNLVTKANEFYDENSKMVKSGTPYHIHYTSQLTQHFMTGAEHSHLSKLIYPLKSDVTQFTYYNSLNKQKPLKLNSQTTIPTGDDYRKKSYKRYFAKQANDKNQPSKETNWSQPITGSAQPIRLVSQSSRDASHTNGYHRCLSLSLVIITLTMLSFVIGSRTDHNTSTKVDATLASVAREFPHPAWGVLPPSYIE